MPATVRSLEERIDDMVESISSLTTRIEGLTQEFGAFRARMETTHSLIRWIGVFFAGLLVTVLYSVFSVAYSGGQLAATVGELKGTTEKLSVAVQQLQATTARHDAIMEQLEKRFARYEETLDKHTKLLGEIHAKVMKP
jgi:prefoldin subunit 5